MRPIGVSILAILIILFGVLVALLGVLGLIGSVFLSTLPGGGLFAGVTGIASAIVLIIGIILIVAGLGLWNLKMWAWVLAIIVLVIELVLSFYPGINVCTLLFALVLLIYLLLIRKEFS